MKKNIRLFQGLLISLLLAVSTSCIHRAPSLRMLDERSGYGKEGEAGRELSLLPPGVVTSSDKEGQRKKLPKTANIWIFPRETENKEVFWGGWVTVQLEDDSMELTRPDDLKSEEAPKKTLKKKKTKENK